MSYASFASLDEAWGGVGNIQPSRPPPTTPRNNPLVEPLPSDVDYNRTGAPIMDDIVNLYTPADSRPDTNVERGRARHVEPPPETKQNEKKVEKAVTREKKHVRKGDDYSDVDSESDSDSGISVKLRKRATKRRYRQRLVHDAGDGDDTNNIIELAAYVLSGVMLIFLFESFITIGGSLRAGSSYY